MLREYISLGLNSEVVKPMTRRYPFFVHVLQAGPVPLVHGDDGVAFEPDGRLGAVCEDITGEGDAIVSMPMRCPTV